MRCGGIAKGKSRPECCCTLVSKDPEQQPMGPFVAARRRSWGTRGAWVVTKRYYPMSESEASAQITGISGGFIGTTRLSERIGKNRMVCTITITMAGVEEVENRELL